MLATTVTCLTGLALAAFAVVSGNYSASNSMTLVVNTKGAGAVRNLHDSAVRAKPGRGVALQTPGWIATGSLGGPRVDHTATLLPSGKILVAGGNSSVSITLRTAELYDPATGMWTSTGSLNIARIRHTATLLPSGKVLVVGGGTNIAELYDPATGSWSITGSLRSGRDGPTATLLPFGKVLVAGGVNSDTAELYDPATGSWSSTGSLSTVRAYHTATLLPSGKVLVAGGVNGNLINSTLSSAELYDPATGSWSSTGSLGAARLNHTATLLPSGKVLVATGRQLIGLGSHPLNSAELYDPATGSWSSTGSLGTDRIEHTATLLPSGKVLVAGGRAFLTGFLSSAELYDPATGSWSSTGSLATTRVQHTSTLLPSGRVVVAGGIASGIGFLSSAELYDPAIGSWSSTGSLSTVRDTQTATLLPSGKVLVAGGYNGDYVSSVELYDPATGNWSSSGNLGTAREFHTATLLPSGKVLVAGGFNLHPLSSAELYDPVTGNWSGTGSLGMACEFHTATLLASGKVLVAGGRRSSGPNIYLSSAELYDPATRNWSSSGNLGTAREFHTATLLPSGKVLVAGGSNGSLLSSAELYDSATGSWSSTGSLGTARCFHTATLLPSGKVLVVGGRRNPGGPEGPGNYSSSAELYDPATGNWSSTGSLGVAREFHTATLLFSGRVLVTGGENSTGELSSVELYDPATGSWSSTASLATARDFHTATLLPSGNVLVAGGRGNSGSSLTSPELYDPGLGFDPGWQPLLTRVFPTILPDGGVLVATGFRFKGVSEASQGNGQQNSSSNYPLIQLLSLTNEQTLFLPVDAMAGWSDNSFISTPITLMTNSTSGFPVGYALVTVFTNGIPSQSQFVVATPKPPETCQVCHKHTATLTVPCNSLEYLRHLGHGDTDGACPSNVEEGR